MTTDTTEKGLEDLIVSAMTGRSSELADAGAGGIFPASDQDKSWIVSQNGSRAFQHLLEGRGFRARIKLDLFCTVVNEKGPPLGACDHENAEVACQLQPHMRDPRA